MSGTLAFLLPYMEQENLYKSFSPNFFNPTGNAKAWAYSTPPMDPNGNQTQLLPGTQMRIKTYECPSDNVSEMRVSGMFVELYPGHDCTAPAGSMCGDYVMPPTPGYLYPASGNYVGCAGGLGSYMGLANASYLLYPGIYYPGSKTKMTDIADGTSNTLAFGETLGGNGRTRDFNLAWFGAGSMPVAWGLPTPENAGWYTFSSRHTGLVQFALADGSVRGLRIGISARTYRLLAGAADGYAVNADN
jgi:hypothetical protein